MALSSRLMKFGQSLRPSLTAVHAPSLSSTTSIRHESTARRTTKRLRNKSDPSFSAAIPQEKLNDHIVFNPPSSAPSPYHTPVAFLPPNDPRRTLLAQSYHYNNPYHSDSSLKLPPLSHKIQTPKKHHLTPIDIEEIRRLRTEDPYTWTRKKLAEKFECSQFFVGIVAEASAEKKQVEAQKAEAAKAKWGRRRREAREERSKRRELWAMDR